ncbi:uncharacterized protein B0P05DRAFT_461242, partial [Gilbertella persicaria]|uniref:uncharacterized protein n=1 Tax=Gilbertella persicaria TaxID=101096 RepID=UPI00221ECD72
YYHLTGSTVYTKRLRREKKAASTTAKTARNVSFSRFADHMLSYMDKLFAFYEFRTAKYRFSFYQGKQRALKIMVNMLLNGGAKYNKKRKRKKRKE